MPHYRELLPGELAVHCDPDSMSFSSTAELTGLEGMLGQERAVEAIEFGLDIDMSGYNLFVHGPEGSGRHSYIRKYLEQRSEHESPGFDWCFVNNFSEPRKPRAVHLPAGHGPEFRHDIATLVDESYRALPAAFESDDYRKRRQAIEDEAQQDHKSAIDEVRQHAEAHGLSLQQTVTGYSFIPMIEGKRLTPDEYEALPDEEKERLEQDTKEIAEELEKVLRSMPRRAREFTGLVYELDRQVALFAVGNLVDELIEKYADNNDVISHLEDLRQDIVDNIQLFLELENLRSDVIMNLLGGKMDSSQIPQDFPLRRYAVNLVVTHAAKNGAPVVFASNPTYQELIGNIEYHSEMGALSTDFTLIKGGDILKANGGYLVLDAYKVLIYPFVWDALKRTLKSGKNQIRSLGQDYGLLNTVSLEPAGIPLDVKVILIGDPYLYYLLKFLDPEFSDLFKISADFDDRMERDGSAVDQYARLLATVAQQESLLAMEPAAVARLVDESTRIVSDQQKLSTQMRVVIDVMREAHAFATKSEAELVSRDHIEQAIAARKKRSSRIRDRMQESILRDTLHIRTEGNVIGQINGLAVIDLADARFGHPARITASVSLGSGGVIDIEREIEMGGPIHSKGILILSSFVASHYTPGLPLSISASLVFEQSYSGIEGDSASMAELCALLSAISSVPLKQSIAITGSVDQFGRMQAIGGVNDKIEGFFEICQARGLDGSHAVIIPESNAKHLMLNQEVIDAVEAGKFHVYAVDNVDAALSLLTDQEAGEPDTNGAYPEGTLNAIITQSLHAYAEQWKLFSMQESGKKKS